jgi:RNA polymerase sigma factor (TIGR02999 family)
MDPGNITILLSEIRVGSASAHAELFARVYAELTRIAKNRLAGGRQTTLDAPSLVHEAYLRLSQQQLTSIRDRRDFFAYSAAVMRNVIIDTIRQRNSQKRGAGGAHVTLSGADAEISARVPDVEALHGALEHLEQIDGRAHKIVELRYFAGLTIEEIADVLEGSTMTVKRGWASARAFLFKELKSQDE